MENRPAFGDDLHTVNAAVAENGNAAVKLLSFINSKDSEEAISLGEFNSMQLAATRIGRMVEHRATLADTLVFLDLFDGKALHRLEESCGTLFQSPARVGVGGGFARTY